MKYDSNASSESCNANASSELDVQVHSNAHAKSDSELQCNESEKVASGTQVTDVASASIWQVICKEVTSESELQWLQTEVWTEMQYVQTESNASVTQDKVPEVAKHK